MEKKKVPEIRLKGFEGEWECVPLKRIAQKVVDKNIEREYTETFTNSAESGIISQRDYFDHDIANADNINAYYIVRDDDFTYNPRISKNAPVGPIKRNKLGRTGIMSPLYTVFRTQDVDNGYLEWYFNSSCWHSYMYFNGDSGARYDRFSIKSDVFFDMPVSLPSLPEQKAIGEYFSHLDALITNAEERYTKLLALKKSLLQKMFPQEGESVPRIRFEGFEGAWEKKRLGDLYECNNERNVNKNIGFDKTISIATMSYKEDGNGAASDSLATYKILRLGDIAFEGHTNKEFLYGRFVLNDIGDGIMSPRFSALRPTKSFPISFWKYYIHHEPVMRNILVNSTKAGTMMNELDIDDFLEQVIYVPGDDEQKAIGGYFDNLDTFIDTQEQKVIKLKQMKSALLQKMFV